MKRHYELPLVRGPVSRLIWLYRMSVGRIKKILKTVTGAWLYITDAFHLPANDLKVFLEPIQDLHGQENPYPAGGGVNLFDEGAVTIGNWYSNNGNLSTNAPYGCVSADIPAIGGEKYAIKCYGETPYSMSIVEFDDNGFLIRSHISNSKTKTVTTTAGTTKIVIQFACGGTADTPMTADILASYQAVFYKGETAPDVYAPYENICPISGRTVVTVFRSAKNLLKTNAVRGYPSATISSSATKRKFEFGTYVVGLSSNNYFSESAITSFSYTNGKLTYVTRTSGYGVGFVLALKPNMTVRFSAVFGVGAARVAFYDVEGNYLGFKATNAPIDVPEKTEYAVLVIYTSQINTEISVENLQIEIGTTHSEYEYGNAEYTTIQLGDTVYGGTWDVTTGKLTVNRVSVDMGTLTWSRTNAGISTEGGYVFYSFMSDMAQDSLMCSMYPYSGAVAGNSAAYNKGNKTLSRIASASRIYIRDDTYTATSDLVTAITGQQLVYYLATPVEIDLTPTQVQMLAGTNNIWSDAGNIELTYYAKGE